MPSHASPDASPDASPEDPAHPARSRSQWTVHGERPVYENPWVDVLMADVELADGTRFEHHVIRTRSAASCVVTRTEAGREEVLLIWRHRFAIDKWVWEIPSGLIEEGEDPADAARREVEEETGWRLSVVLATVGEYVYTGDDGLDRHETDFLVRVDGDLSRPRLEAGKHTEFRWLGPDQLAVLDESGETSDGMIRRIAEDGFAVLHTLGM